MAARLKTDASAADAWVETDLGSDQSDLWVTFGIEFSAAALAAWSSFGGSGYFGYLFTAGPAGLTGFWADATSWWDAGFGASGGTATPDVEHLCEFHYEAGVAVELYVDTVLAFTVAEGTSLDARFVRVGQYSSPNDPDLVVYFSDVKVGTTRGGDDLFADDFESGNLLAWTTTSGDVLVEGAADPTMASGGRVLIAFDDPALEPDPTWTIVDGPDYPNLVAGVDIHRGRQTEVDQTETSTATVHLHDTDGLFDPANTGSPYFGLLDGKQITLQCWNPVALEWVPQWRGFIDDYGYDLHPSQVVSNIQIQCVDAFDYLARVEMIPGLFGDAPPAGSEGVVFYEDTDFQTRAVQLLTDAAWPSALRRVFTGNVEVQESKYDPGDPILTALRDVADAEFPGIANLYVDKRGIVCLHGRFARFDPDSVSFDTDWDFRRWKAGDGAAIIADPDRAQIRPPLTWSRPRSRIVNAGLAYPRFMETDYGGGTFTEADIPGQSYVDTASRDEFGYKSWSAVDLITLRGTTTMNNAQSETRLFAAFYVENYKLPRTRVEALTLKSIDPDDPRAAATWGLICGADISDVVNLEHGYPGGVGLSENFYIEGSDMTIRPLNPDYDMVELTLNVSAESYYDVDVFA